MDIPDELIIETLTHLSTKSLLTTGIVCVQFKTLTEVPYVITQLPHITLGDQLMLKDSILRTEEDMTDQLVRNTDKLFEENDGLLWCLTIITSQATAATAAKTAAKTAARDAVLDTALDDAFWVAALNASWDATWNVCWEAAWNVSWNAAWNTAWDAIWNSAVKTARNAIWNATRNTVWNAARDVACDSAQCLTNHKDIGNMCYQVAKRYTLMNLKDTRDLCREILDEKIPSHRSLKPEIKKLPGNPFWEQYNRLFNNYSLIVELT